MAVFEYRVPLDAPSAEVFRWHARPGAFVRLSPPWHRVDVIDARGGIENGARLTLRLGPPPFSVEWVAVHQGFEEGRRFVDVQESGPFADWTHEHTFEDAGAGRSVVHDRIDYTLPFGSAGAFALDWFTRRTLARVFGYRAALLARDLARHAPYFGRPPLKVAISGASGLIGSQLAAFLTTGGHDVLRIVRGRKARDGEIAWNPSTGRIDHEALEGLDAVVHLAAESIASGRWTEERKAEIAASRINGTKLLAEALSVLRTPPKVFLSASAVGYYGAPGFAHVDESGSSGTGFLAEVARAWEDATQPAALAGIRTATMRFGVVLTSRGGAVAKMRLPFKLGAGGPVGGGFQGFSWIALDDAVYAIHHLIRSEALRGPVNVVAPEPPSQREFAAALGRAMHRPAIVPLPAPIVKGLFGQMGEEVLLSGPNVKPSVLKRSVFVWSAPSLDEALAR